MKPIDPIVRSYEWGMPSFQSSASMYIDKCPDKVAELWWMTPNFLLKLLFVAQPLSLQLHPTEEQVNQYFFPDPYPKPEIVIAETDGFQALCGFLEEEEIQTRISKIPTLSGLTDFHKLFALHPVEQKELLLSVQQYAHGREETECLLFLELAKLYPLDVATLAPFYMHHVCLKKGQALIIPGAQPHCYLSGEGIECMPPSDNIVRCGLTRKECDVELFFEMCRTPQKPIIQSYPYDHPALDPYFTMRRTPLHCPKNSICLIKGLGAWWIEEETEIPCNKDALVVIPT